PRPIGCCSSPAACSSSTELLEISPGHEPSARPLCTPVPSDARRPPATQYLWSRNNSVAISWVVCGEVSGWPLTTPREEEPGKRIDTHTHPKMSKHFLVDPAAVERMVRMARRVGLDGLALTEHFHGRDFWTIYERLVDVYPMDRGVFRADGVALIPGAEVNIREGAHIIV